MGRDRREPAPPVTPERLHAAALRHLARYACSVASLRRVLGRRVERSVRAHGSDPEVGRQMVEAELQRLIAAGLLDDATYADTLARSLRRRGASRRLVRARMSDKGVGGDLAAAALAEE